MNPSRVRVRRLAVALATAACLFGGTIPALAGDKDKKPRSPDQESPAPPPAPAPEPERETTEQQATPAPPAANNSQPRRQSSADRERESAEVKPKKPDSDSVDSDDTSGSDQGPSSTSDSSGSSGQGSSSQPAPAAPAPAPPGQTATPAPGSTDTSDPTRQRDSGGRDGAAERRRDRANRDGSAGTGAVLGTTAAGDPAVAPLGPVGVVAEGTEEASGGERGDRAGADTDFRADDRGAPVTQTVREIVEVVPGPMKAAIAGLAIVALLFAFHSLVTGTRARRLARQREDLLDEVGLLQAALLPAVPRRLGDLVSTVAYRPAEGPAAGGDFYDAFVFDGGRVGVIVGDVSGHGREALARTALMRYTLRAYLDAGLEPRAALKVAGSVLDDDLGDDFATVVVAVYDPESGTLTYAGAGHPPPILLGPPAHEPVTACSSPPIGAGATTGLRQTTLALPQGSIACFFTDGMTDARVGDQFLGRERLAELLAELGPGATAPMLLERVAEVCDRTPDDMAACILHADGSGSGRLRVEELEVSRNDLQGTAVVRFMQECGIPMAEVPNLLRTACDTARDSGSAVLRVRMGDWRPGIDVLPGNVETLVAARRASAALAHSS